MGDIKSAPAPPAQDSAQGGVESARMLALDRLEHLAQHHGVPDLVSCDKVMCWIRTLTAIDALADLAKRIPDACPYCGDDTFHGHTPPKESR